MARKILGFCAALVLIFVMAACNDVVEPYDITSTQTRGSAVSGGGGGGVKDPSDMLWTSISLDTVITGTIDDGPYANPGYEDRYVATYTIPSPTFGTTYRIVLLNVSGGEIDGIGINTPPDWWIGNPGIINDFVFEFPTAWGYPDLEITIQGTEGTAFRFFCSEVGGGTGGGGLPDFGEQAPVGFVDSGNWGPGLKMFELSPNSNTSMVAWTDTADVYFVDENGSSQNFFSDAGWAIIPQGFTDAVYAVMVTSTPDYYEFSFQETDPAYSSYLPQGDFICNDPVGNGEIDYVQFLIASGGAMQPRTVYTDNAALMTAQSLVITVDTGDNHIWDVDGEECTFSWNDGLGCYVCYGWSKGNLYAWGADDVAGPDGTSKVGTQPYVGADGNGVSGVDLNSPSTGADPLQWEIEIGDPWWLQGNVPWFTVVIDFDHAAQEVKGFWMDDSSTGNYFVKQ